MNAIARVLATVALALACPGSAAEGQDHPRDEGWIAILEPEEWRGEGTRGIVVRQRQSIRVVGLAYHPTGVSRVMVNGQIASMTPDGSGQVRFAGFVPVRPASRDVEIVAYSGGPPIIRMFRLELIQGPPAATPAEEAWYGGAQYEGQRFAVVIGVSQYEDSAITPLRYADEDARAFYEFLRSPAAGLGGFPEENILLLVNEQATQREMNRAFSGFLRQVTERDIVVIYFAGHGAPDPSDPNQYYLIPYDADFDDLQATAKSMAEVSEAIEQVEAKHLLVLTDACHAGATATGVGLRGDPSNLINQRFLEGLRSSQAGFSVFAASQKNQYSQEDTRWGGGHGVFTYFLLRGLQGEADQNDDHIVDLEELVVFVKDRVERETARRQQPALSEHNHDPFRPMAVVLDKVAVSPGADTTPGLQPAQPRPTVEPPNLEAPQGSLDTAQVKPDSAEVDLAAETRAQSGASLAAMSLLLPGSGHFASGRPVTGAIFLSASAGALAVGLGYRVQTVRCKTLEDPCPPASRVRGTVRRPYLIASLATAGGVAMLAAIDAARGASRGRDTESGSQAFGLLPMVAPTAGGKSLETSMGLELSWRIVIPRY